MPRWTANERASYAQTLRKIAPLSDADIEEGLALTKQRHLERGEHLLRAGEHATEVAVVVSGLLREYFVLANGVERTKALIIEGQLSGSLADLLSSGPSRAFIVAEEPTHLLVTRFEDYRALGKHSTSWSALGRRAVERLLLAKAEREWELLGLDAEARYVAFRSRNPGLEGRVAAKHVASYLGITAEHLSRLRRRLSRPHGKGAPSR